MTSVFLLQIMKPAKSAINLTEGFYRVSTII
ncbi:hypothetical protein J2772_000195 [Chryseobacterium jejuense]|nr:hypothetical protein [Chryseobacterium jejuense]